MRPSPRMTTCRLLALFLAPCLGQLAASDWIPLFNSRNLEGWRAAEHPASIKVEDGAIVCAGPRAHLFYTGPIQDAQFRNFEFTAEVRTSPGANSGIFFHTAYQESDWPAQGFEIQINNSHHGEGGYRELKKTGSLYGIRNLYRAVARDDEWFTLRLAVRANRVTVHVNNLQTVDYVQPDSAGPEGALGRGTFALQCHDPHSRVLFRNLKVRPLPDELPPARAELPVAPGHYRRLLALHSENIPVIDLHAHLKGGLTIEDVLERFHRTGINYGIAVNGGIGFPVTNDAGIYAFRESLAGHPVFVALQAEGREWIRLFSPEAVRQFDYVFTDAMTFTDDDGHRTRLWMEDEVHVGDPDAFMDMLVRRIVDILDHEPIDIYVNATFLPDVLAADYDRLWTPTRMDQVIDAAVRNDIAIEINDRYRIPSVAFVKRAKQKGARFTFGTNNGGRDDLGYLGYALEVQRACDLTTEDLFVPGWKPSRANRRP
ncbi:MAG: DUF1080 domain-containing protein [Verrucomicrobia bacterium]|nr:DUF1080 domain-containing protein [Verrucomicrobiota bacterium]